MDRRGSRMITGTAICGEYQQLLQELTSAVQLCAEYDSPFVLPIDFGKLTPERAVQLRDAAVKQRNRVGSLFTDLRAYFACTRLEPPVHCSAGMIAIAVRRTRLVLIPNDLWERRNVLQAKQCREGTC
jgi:hypothetical protein